MGLLTIGSVAFDSIETPFGKADKIVGGACTYISWAASYFLEDINLVSVIGGDFPSSEIEKLEERGVDMRGLEIRKDEKSFFWSGRYHDNMNGRDTLVTDLNVLADFNPVLPQEYLTSDYVMLGNLSPSVQMNVLNQFKRRPKLIALDTMNFWMDVAMDELLAVLKKIDVLTINDDEARQLSGEFSLVNAAAKILSMGPKYLIIKKGEHGALLFGQNDIFYVPGLPLSIVKDPTGAGDTFAGGFIGYLASTDDISFNNFKRAIVYGSAMASYCVEEFGLNKLQNISKDMIRQRVMKFRDLVTYNI